ncbi:hypothetical protein KRP22_007798 [Phytophthora ramorum]|nr:Secreted RxLR effector protein 124 [Phytophthora ramorum]
MNDAAAGDHKEILQWIFEQGHDGGSDHALELAAKNGRMDMVQWLLDRRLGRYALYSMKSTICKGHLDIVKYLNERQMVGGASDMMNEAATHGHLDIVKWLCEKYRDEPYSFFPPHYRSEDNDGYSSQTAMGKAAGMGHLHVLEFLHSLVESAKAEDPICSD